MFKKIMIIGCPGAGKSTFARSLRDITGIPLYYLDMIWHRADKTNIPRDEFDKKLEEIIEKSEWIIDGNYGRTLETRIKKCDTVFLMDFPLEVCLAGAESRIGKKREDMPWIETEFDEEFKEWITGFSERELPHICKLLEQYKAEKTIVIFKTRYESESYLNKLMQEKSYETVI